MVAYDRTGPASVVVATMVLLLSSSCIYGQGGFDCVGNSPQIQTRCGPELQYANAVIRFNRTDEPSKAEMQSVKDAFEENKLPSKGCCEIAKAFSDEKCICNASIRQLLPVLGFEVVAINSVMSIIQDSCGGFKYVADC